MLPWACPALGVARKRGEHAAQLQLQHRPPVSCSTICVLTLDAQPRVTCLLSELRHSGGISGGLGAPWQ